MTSTLSPDSYALSPPPKLPNYPHLHQSLSSHTIITKIPSQKNERAITIPTFKGIFHQTQTRQRKGHRNAT
ncbi:hypothetical protein CC78DRAFT_96057 [Lojkania enalia]|uniref:Uncharacterized protein n=1 Tax=Lojkania enalia TaxID=147567 RepID=A0A9P4MVA5_9PLEO|nr:hypothetical protein CC78DRAFT_96057 [Didymosphaeria enalia]